MHCKGNSMARWNKRVNDFQSKLIAWSRHKFKLRAMQIEEKLEHLGHLQKRLVTESTTN